MNYDKRKLKPRFVILQDNKIKVVWDVFVMLILIAVTLIIPYRLAFVLDDELEWQILYYFFDFMFTVDILLCFFTSYTDSYHKTEVVGYKAIVRHYLIGWFTVDLISVIPFDTLLT